jgi:hypothetical protein
VAPSRRLRRRQVEDGRIDVTDCVGLSYPNVAVFNVLRPSGIVVILHFTVAYKYDSGGLGLLVTSHIFISIS